MMENYVMIEKETNRIYNKNKSSQNEINYMNINLDEYESSQWCYF